MNGWMNRLVDDGLMDEWADGWNSGHTWTEAEKADDKQFM